MGRKDTAVLDKLSPICGNINTKVESEKSPLFPLGADELGLCFSLAQA
jgi:hypothetical protein